ncbi:hypothetical protein RvY_18420-2 [Ramazzottius varieornatus]|uniref:t-SNARE coiled-coil homology domain-containing protein n=1 Tax=Ramazzottius varieornatus TaxID=947166 RepID=A0A1D1WAE9_RAMVA|nr:hypothetical protein RvY_18420-2 [Ramazzottius varieornatus]
MPKDRLPEFRGKRNSFRVRVLKAVRSLSMLSESEKDCLEEATQLSNSPLSLFFNKVSRVVEILSAVEQKVVGLERLHRAHTSVHNQDPESFSIGALALHTSRNIVSTTARKELHEIGIHEVFVLCSAARDNLEEAQAEATTRPFAQLSDYEKTIMKEQYRLVSERLKDVRERFGHVQANFELYVDQRKEFLAESSLRNDPDRAVREPTAHGSDATGYVTRNDSQDTEWTVVNPEVRTEATKPTMENYTSLSDAAMQLRDLRKIEAEALVVKRLFDDIAFFVDFQEHSLKIAEENVEKAKETILIVSNEISDKAATRRRASKLRIGVALAGSLVVLSIVGGGLAYFSTGRPVPADFLGMLAFALMLLVAFVFICNKCAEKVMRLRFRKPGSCVRH